MSTFKISPATSLHFRIETDTGTIRAGESIADNYLFTEADAQRFFDNSNIQFPVQSVDQCFECADVVTFQVQYEKTGNLPIIRIYDDNAVQVDEIYPTLLDATSGIWNFTITWSNYTCNTCYHVEILTPNINSSLSICASNGSFDTMTGTSTGGNNTLNQALSPTRTGARSGQVVGAGVPAVGSDVLFYCTNNFSLTANTYYLVEIWIRGETGDTQICTGEASIELDISEFSDATSILSITANPNDQLGTWHRVAHFFKTGVDVTGHIYLQIAGSTLPEANGILYIDDYSVQENTAGTEIVEATSEKISLNTKHTGTVLIAYDCDSDAFDMDYSTTPWNNSIRVHVLPWYQFHIDDQDDLTVDNSAGGQSRKVSRPRKINDFHFSSMPPYMVEKLCLALKHENVLIDGVAYVLKSEEFTPDWAPWLGSVAAELIVADYPMNFNDC